MDPENIKKGIEQINNAAHQLINFEKLAEFSNNLEESFYKNVLASTVEKNYPRVI